MNIFFGGPVQTQFPIQSVTGKSGWADRMLDIVVSTFGNAGTAILLVLFFGFILWMRFRQKH